VGHHKPDRIVVAKAAAGFARQRPGWRGRVALLRIAAIPLALLVTSALCFGLLHWAPGGPFSTEQLADPVLRQNLEAAYGLGRPWWAQWLQWCMSAAQGSWGTSFQHRGVAVAEIVGPAWVISVALGATAVIIALALALPSAIHVARCPHAAGARVVVALADGLLSVPTFVSAPLLLALAASAPWSWLRGLAGGESFLLAAVSLALPLAGMAFYWTRLGLQEILATPWWTAVLGRRLPETIRWWRYGLGYGWPTLAGRLSPVVADLLTGALAVELVCGVPGLGRVLGAAALHRDTPVLLAGVTCSVVTVMVLQTLLDLAHLHRPPADASARGTVATSPDSSGPVP
jgi:oligopeptide transport system permease protein